LPDLVKNRIRESKCPNGTLIAFKKNIDRTGSIDNDPQKEKLEKLVDVEVLDMRWFYNDRKTFINLTTILQNMPIRFIGSKFTTILLEKFWTSI